MSASERIEHSRTSLAVALNPSQGGSTPRHVERPAQLQQLQQFAVSGLQKGEQIRPSKAHSIFVGISTPTNRVDRTDEDRVGKAAGDDAAKRNKKGETETGGENHQNKALRGIEDGLLLVVTARINGHPVRALIDSGATRCFVTPCLHHCSRVKGCTPRHFP